MSRRAVPFLDVKKFAARIVGAKSFVETARELVPDSVATPRHRALADAHQTVQILNRLLRPMMHSTRFLGNPITDDI
jgi:inhibitor of KinA sporulation pathway (predicted exonuclease)